MLRKLGKALQILAFMAGLVLTPLWCVLAVVVVPWIVPADVVGSVGGYEDASKAALGVAVLCAAGMVLASGVLTRRRTRWAVAAALLAGHAVAGCYLYPYPELSDQRAVICLTLQGASVVVVLIGAACGLPESMA